MPIRILACSPPHPNDARTTRWGEMPRSCPWPASGNGRDFLFAVSADSCHSTRQRLNGWSSSRRAQRFDPLLAFSASFCSAAMQRKRAVTVMGSRHVPIHVLDATTMNLTTLTRTHISSVSDLMTWGDHLERLRNSLGPMLFRGQAEQFQNLEPTLACNAICAGSLNRFAHNYSRAREAGRRRDDRPKVGYRPRAVRPAGWPNVRPWPGPAPRCS